jgi:hypothetical protein
MLPEPETKLKLVPRLLGITPLSKFVAPCEVELRSAKLVRLDGVKQDSLRTIRPFD